MYNIEQFPSKRRIKIRFGMFEDHDSSSTLLGIQQAVMNVKGTGEHFDMLTDYTSSMVMPQNIADGSKELAEWLLANGLRRSANIVQSVTHRMQIARVTKRDPRFAFFGTREEAEAWLDSGLI